MANTTFNGPVRSENGFIGATKNTTTGVFTNNFEINSSGDYVGTKLQGQDIVATAKVNATAGTNEVTYAQPARSIITSIQLVCTSSPTVASGDIGFKVGTATGGAAISCCCYGSNSRWRNNSCRRSSLLYNSFRYYWKRASPAISQE